MEANVDSSDYEQSSSQDGESRPASGVGSYEDDFEKGLECELSCSYEDDKLEDLIGSNATPCAFQNDDHYRDWRENGERYKPPVVLDHMAYRDCDEDLENELTLGLQQCRVGNVTGSHNGHFYHFERDANDKTARSRTTRFLEFFRRTRSISDSQDNFFDAAEEVGYDSTPDSGVHENLQNMDPEQRARLEEEWRNELAKTEEEIQTLRSVLAAKVRHSQDLKRKLGITVWREFRDDFEQGFKNVKESDAFAKTEEALKTASEKTTTVIGTVSASVTKKLGEIKNSPTFKSFEEKVGSAYTNVKTKVSGSRSSSMQSFEEALANTEGRKSTGATPATTPMIPEEKPLL